MYGSHESLAYGTAILIMEHRLTIWKVSAQEAVAKVAPAVRKDQETVGIIKALILFILRV